MHKNGKRFWKTKETCSFFVISFFCNFFSDTLLEQIINQAQHVVLRLRTMYVIDSLAKEIKDPLIVSHWNTLTSPNQSTVKINIFSHGYETLSRTSLVVHVFEKSIKVICRDGKVMHVSYEPQELRDLILSQVTRPSYLICWWAEVILGFLEWGHHGRFSRIGEGCVFEKMAKFL